MPNIPITKAAPALKSITPATPKPISGVPIKSSTSKSKTYTGTRILPGGMKTTHTSNVIDNSRDTSQTLPYIANCLSCGWQARVSDKETAEMMARGHVGQ